MNRFHLPAGRGLRGGPVLLRGLPALLAGIGVALLALVTLGVAFALLPAMRRRSGRFRSGSPSRFGAGGGVPPGSDRAASAARASATPHGDHEPSHAEVLDLWPIALVAASLAALALAPAGATAKLLVPMDEHQADHLRAYGLTYWTLARGEKCEWLLNYRGGSFLLPEDAAVEREANLRGVTFESVGGADEARMRAEIADNNMEAVALEKPPRVAVYIPPNTPPWDDAVTLALKYADIPYTTVWDEDVLRGDLAKCDWLHLHHEDFTGQHGKFWAAYHSFPWYKEEETVQRAMAAKLGFAKVTQLKAAVAVAIRDFVAHGGFMFGMCSATDTYDIALAAQGLDIAGEIYDGDPANPGASSRLDFSGTLAFRNFHLEMDPVAYRFSDIDVTADAARRGSATQFTLFDFSAKNDPVPCMLVQDHVAAVNEFLGQSTGFRRALIKSGVLALGEVEGTDEVKYLHGQFGRGTFTFLGGHDPEDYQHMVGDPPTDLSKFRHSPGYRLILNNVLFPAAEKKKQRT